MYFDQLSSAAGTSEPVKILFGVSIPFVMRSLHKLKSKAKIANFAANQTGKEGRMRRKIVPLVFSAVTV